MVKGKARQNRKVLQSFANIYNTAHLFNLKKGTVNEIYAFKQVHDYFEQNKERLTLQELIHFVIKRTTNEKYLKTLLEFTDFSTLQERLKGHKSISMDFFGIIHGWTRGTFIPVSYDKNGNLIEFVYTTVIIQKEKEREEKLYALVEYDELTGVYNRHAYAREKRRIEEEGIPENLNIISFDVNGLKTANDTLGHDVGDELLIGTADCIKNVFGNVGKIYRVGGDEFICLIECTFKEIIKLMGVFNTETSNWKGKNIKSLTVAKGCTAHLEFPDLNFEELQSKADRRMYLDKEEYYASLSRDVNDYLKNPDTIHQILKNSNMGLVSIEITDDENPRLQIDDFIKAFLGLRENISGEELYLEWINRVHPDYSDSVVSAIEKIVIGNQVEFQYPWYHPKAGLVYVRSSGFRDASYTKGVRINGFFQDITALSHFQKDSLTGLYTKDLFFQKVDEILSKNPNKNFKILVSDIENFKAINEKYGIHTGDLLLEYLAKSLRIMAPNLILAGRVSADKFVCLQETGTPQSREEGFEIQNKIMENAPVQNFLWKHGIYYTEFDRNISAQTMYDRATFAVESIKGDYEVYCAVYDDVLSKKLSMQHQILANMEDALKNQEFKVYLQPKFDLKKNRTGGAEALVRWVHPEIGFMNPGEFIPVFEQNGFVKNVDQFVFVEVCKLLRRWLDEDKPIIPISINLSRRDFENNDIAEGIISMVDSYKLPHNLIHLELTESAFSDNPDKIANAIHRLHDSGFVIELDDFGSGYSSLTSLSEIEFDILKLDMSIIRNDKPNTRRNVLDMCYFLLKQMNFKSVAEGVENEEQLQRLKDLGCDYIQGYYFSKPLPIEDFEEYLKKEFESHDNL